MTLGRPLDGRLPLRAAFFDIDGTLVGFHEKEMRDSVYDALFSLREKGVKLFISSGRCRALIHNLRDFPFDGYITCTGALVEMGDEILYSCPVPREALVELVPLFYREGISAVAFFRDRVLRNFSNDVSRHIDELLHVGPFCEEGFEEAVAAEPVYGLTVYVDQEGEDRFLYVACNLHWEDQEFALPYLPDGMCWTGTLSSDETWKEEGAGYERTLVLPGRTIMVLEGLKEEKR